MQHITSLSGAIKPVSGPLLSTLFLLMGVALLHTITALHGEALGFSTVGIGVLSTAYYIGFFAGTYSIPRIIHRIGHIRTFAFCTTIVAVVVLVQAITSAYWTWFALRVAQGLALVGLYTIIESWLNAAADQERRSTVFAIYMMLNLGGMAIGQQLLRINDDAMVLFVVTAILFSVASMPVTTTRQRQPHVQEPPKLEIGRLFHLVPTALVSAVASGLIGGAMWGLLPLYARSRGMDTAAIGTYLSITILGGVVLQWPLGYFGDHIDRRLALAIIGLGAALLAAAIGLVPTHQPAIGLALIFLFGGISMTIYPIAVAHLVDYVDRDELLAASSTVLLMEAIGSACGPLVAGMLMDVFQPATLFLYFAVLAALLAAYTLHRFMVRKREITPADNFMPMAQTSPSALDLHPGTINIEVSAGPVDDDLPDAGVHDALR